MGDPVVHFEINGPDDELVAKFYSELFGWHTESMPEPPYTTIDTHGGAGINGGIAKADRPYSTIYVGSDDLQGRLDRAGALGASTTVPVTDIPNVGAFAQFADPDGNLIGLFKPGEGEQPGIAIWAESEDQQGYLDRAVELGGTAIMPPTEMSGGLKIAMFADPQGTFCGVYSYKQ